MSRHVDIEPLENALKAVEKRGEVAVLLDELISVIAKYPTADVQEVRHGRWIVKHGILAGDGIYGDMGECSVCGLHLRNYEWDYCPNCGALMVNEDDNTD